MLSIGKLHHYIFLKKVRTLLKFLGNLKQTKYMFKVSLLHIYVKSLQINVILQQNMQNGT